MPRAHDDTKLYAKVAAFELTDANVREALNTVTSTNTWTSTVGYIRQLDIDNPTAGLAACLNIRWTSARTIGDGACGVHALFGVPRNDAFDCVGARDFIVKSFRRGETDQTVRDRAHEIIDGAWRDLNCDLQRLVKPANESLLWWEALSRDVQNACVSQSTVDAEQDRLRRMPFAKACRDFFSATAIAGTVQRPALEVQAIPASMDVRHADIHVCATMNRDYGWLRPAFERRNHRLVVRGTAATPVPADGP